MKRRTIHFSIISPSYNALSCLPACLQSVRDQCGEHIHIHHHIQDGHSNDGTVAYLAQWQEEQAEQQNYSFSYESRPDAGMYDALNRAWAGLPACSDYAAHLNCDEQYLPLALRQVCKRFEQYPQADILLGSYIILDAQQRYICHRRPVQPKLWSSWLNCACITNSCFIRAKSFKYMHYDSRWRCIGDMVLYRRLLQQKLTFQIIPDMTSSFTCTGSNLAWTSLAEEEGRAIKQEAPYYARAAVGLIYRWVNLQRRLRDLFCSPPTSYAIYHPRETQRREVSIPQATCRWNGRTSAE